MDQDRFEGAARKVGGTVEGAVGDLTGDTKMQAEGAMDRMAGGAQRGYGQAKDAVRDAAGSAGDQVSDYGSQMLDQIEEAGDFLAEQIDHRPITALLLAGGIGFLIALASKPTPRVSYLRR
ncbi:MAG: CsbD family protein [Gemmatimonadaceae bacterium]|nr:CsbD family protein [Acetobacteraceae bacterium]